MKTLDREVEHMISRQLLQLIKTAVTQHLNWMAYNSASFFLRKGDAFSFKDRDTADEFAARNISENLRYRVIPVETVEKVQKLLLNPRAQRQFPAARENSHTIHHHSSPINKKVMNEKNVEYLLQQLQQTGFDREKEVELREKIRLNLPEFSLVHHASIGKDLATAQLHFKKSAESDRYYFNSYQLTVRNMEGEDKVKHTFYIHPKEDNITFSEGVNLLSGRAVHKQLTNKEGENYQAWLQLDFKEIDTNGSYRMKQFHQNYGFDLGKALNALPLRELKNEGEKQLLLQSLQRGDRRQVTVEHGGREHPILVEASPQFKSLNLYDQNGQRMGVRYLLEQTNASQSVKATGKRQQQKEEEEEGHAASQKKGRRQSLS